jgi:hypothetical protein
MTPQQFVARLRELVGNERYQEATDLAAAHYAALAPLLTFEEHSFLDGMMEVAADAAEARAALDAERMAATTTQGRGPSPRTA